MALDLLERDPFLLALDELLAQAGEGHGRIALVSGEAGIGKTSLVERFFERHQPTTRILWGACEALFTPRPLGPLYDIARQTQTPLRTLLDGEAKRATLFAAVLDELTPGPAPTILVVEDIHWADEATLDLIKFLARRIYRTSSLLILTYRDDELTRDHPLRLVLGDLPYGNVARFRLPPLSEAAVMVLARAARRPARQLYEVTGGNPFFLTEVLASDTLGAPPTVRDAVLARMARFSPEACRLLELVAVVPNRTEWWVVETTCPEDGAALDECLAVGMLRLEGGAVGFRHELARQAVEDSLSSVRKRALHARVLRFAPEAARQAAAQGAHREAAAHYRTALRSAGDLDDEQRAALLDGVSYELYLTGQIEEAIQTRTAALAIWRALDQKEQVGRTLRQLSRLYWFRGRVAESHRYAMEAVELLETLPPGQELAMAYGNMAQLRMLVSDTAQTVVWGTRAIELAEQLHDDEIVCYTLNTIGSSEMCGGNEGGQVKLEQSLQSALEHGYEEHVARAYTNLASNSVRCRAYTQAAGYLQEGLDYCVERDLDSWGHSMLVDRARVRLDQGDWTGADEDVMTVLNVPWTSTANRIPALTVLGLVRVRRGDPGVEAVLDEARDLAQVTGEMQDISPVAAVRAEWRWLQGDREACLAEAQVGVQKASHLNRPWYLGEVAVWFWRGGGSIDPSDEVAAPFAVQMAGDWRAAADAWEQLGCPYEQALALMDGDEVAQRAALELFEHLGAAPAAEIVRRQLRAVGVRGLPRGPRPATRGNPLGLTARQLEILLLLAEGLRNPEIADRLSTTPKTVEHHVSAVLAKLNVRSRAEAVSVAYQLGIIPQSAIPPTSKIGM
jgi:DNA-binding CsgD family transcriptional regulator/tetratricopeptide (TPR) repeat protein